MDDLSKGGVLVKLLLAFLMALMTLLGLHRHKVNPVSPDSAPASSPTSL